MDHAALGASLVCLVHCLALPLVFAALPALSSVVPVSRKFHLAMLAFAVPVSGYALITGRARHGAWWPAAVGTIGLALLIVGVLTFGETLAETPVTVSGALALAIAHIANLRLRHAH